MEFLKPFLDGHKANALEADLSAIFAQLYAENLAARDDDLEYSGVTFLGDGASQARFSAQDGISLFFDSANAALFNQIFRAWSSRRVKRGLNFLDFYLRMLYPDQYGIVWLWHSRNLTRYPYPAALSTVESADYFATHRFILTFDDSVSNAEIGKILPSFRSVVPSEYVLQGVVRDVNLGQQALGFATGAAATACVTFELGAAL